MIGGMNWRNWKWNWPIPLYRNFNSNSNSNSGLLKNFNSNSNSTHFGSFPIQFQFRIELTPALVPTARIHHQEKRTSCFLFVFERMGSYGSMIPSSEICSESTHQIYIPEIHVKLTFALRGRGTGSPPNLLKELWHFSFELWVIYFCSIFNV